MEARREAQYMSGLGNHFSSEAIPGTLPRDQNSPQRVQRGLYAEQLSGSAFTAPRSANLSSWLYRIRPSVMHKKFIPMNELTQKTFFKPTHLNPNQMRWNPIQNSPKNKLAFREKNRPVRQNFLESIRTVCGNGSSFEQRGLHIHLYSFEKEMESNYLMNADGDFLFIPYDGSLELITELGRLEVAPHEIALIPRGMKFQVNPLNSPSCSGYLGENFGAPFRLPELGPIGANGLAHRRHFLTPVANYDSREGKNRLIGKWGGSLWETEIQQSPCDVVAWHGNYVPFKYNLNQFNTINTVSFDHPDPSLFTVLTSGSDTPGVANADFVIFPARWMVAEHSFRPPYFHRNCMSEYMGLIHGVYDAKTSGGFVPGGGSLHNFYSAHGPDSETYEKAIQADLKPFKIENTLAFMFESRFPYLITDFALQKGFLQDDYQECWQHFKKQFI